MLNLIKKNESASKFRKDERGSITVEFLLMVPLLIWALLATLTFFYSYRADYSATKATNIVADLLSRETQYITPNHLDGLSQTLDFLMKSNTNSKLRVTAFRWSEDEKSYNVIWSKQKGGAPSPLTTGSLAGFEARLPSLGDGQSALLVETWATYNPLSLTDLGFSEFEFSNFVVTYPRFTPQLCFNTSATESRLKAQC